MTTNDQALVISKRFFHTLAQSSYKSFISISRGKVRCGHRQQGCHGTNGFQGRVGRLGVPTKCGTNRPRHLRRPGKPRRLAKETATRVGVKGRLDRWISIHEIFCEYQEVVNPVRCECGRVNLESSIEGSNGLEVDLLLGA